jgi:DNA-binding FadR family transcriptional regulator
MSEPGSLIRSLAGRPAARNFHSYVISEIGAGIVSGKYPVGGTLPNDAAMMAQFDVSRTVLREALKTLESKGLVEARPKVGTKVSPRSRWNYFDPMVLAWLNQAGLDQGLLRQLTDVRLAMEPQAAAEVAKLRTADDLRLMSYWIHQMEKSLDAPLNFAMADFEFHVAIANAGKNPFMKSLLGVMELGHCCAYKGILAGGTNVEAKLLKGHATLMDCLERRDEAGARRACTVVINQEYRHALAFLQNGGG